MYIYINIDIYIVSYGIKTTLNNPRLCLNITLLNIYLYEESYILYKLSQLYIQVGTIFEHSLNVALRSTVEINILISLNN